MSHDLEFVSIGDQKISGVPLRCVALAEPNAAALYQRRLEAVRTSTVEYICFVDGGEDECLPDFCPAMQALASEGLPLGYAAETIHGRPRRVKEFSLANFIIDFSMIHHGVVCRVDALQAIDWPIGCYSFEALAYGTLAQKGCVFDPVPRYDWRPGPDGARMWPDYARGVINSLRFLQGLPGVHTQKELQQ